jgi:CheY-like chemotaxis protein
LQGPIDVQSAINTLDRVTREKLGMDDTILLPIMAQRQSAGVLPMAGSDSATSLDATALPNVPLPSIIAGSMVTTAQPRAVNSDSSDLLSLTATRSGATQPKERPATVRALIVDDSLPVRIQMRQALQPFSWKVDYAETGEEALPMLDANDYDIVFLDVVMPGIDGYEVCRYAKSGRARETPVVMLTSASSPADRVKGKLAGCNTYLIKPVTPPVLKQLIEQYLSVR